MKPQQKAAALLEIIQKQSAHKNDVLILKTGSVQDIIEILEEFMGERKRVTELEGALTEIADDADVTKMLYEKNGPQWTSPQGNEYYDASFVIDKTQEIANQARAALKDTDR